MPSLTAKGPTVCEMLKAIHETPRDRWSVLTEDEMRVLAGLMFRFNFGDYDESAYATDDIGIVEHFILRHVYYGKLKLATPG